MRRRGANRYRRRGPGAPQARPTPAARRGAPGATAPPPQEPLSAAGFLAELSAGGARPELVELGAGLAVPVPRPGPGGAVALAALHARLREAATRPGGAAPLAAPLVRVGPYDLWRPALGLVAGARRAFGGALPAHASVEATALLLAVEALPDRGAVVRRLAGYAAAAVAEVWVIDVRSGWTEAYRSPWAGAYRSRTLWYPGEALPLRALPGAAVVALEAA